MAQENQRPRTKGEKDEQLSKELEATFPASDSPASTQPGAGITGAEVVPSENDRHEAIRRRAHQIWRDEGEAHGRDKEHWDAAEAEFEKHGKEAANSNRGNS